MGTWSAGSVIYVNDASRISWSTTLGTPGNVPRLQRLTVRLTQLVCGRGRELPEVKAANRAPDLESALPSMTS